MVVTFTDQLVLDSVEHDVDLALEQESLLRFFERGLDDPLGRFSWLGVDGTPDHDRPLGLYAVARLVHCFSIEHLFGRVQARHIAQRGVDHLLRAFRDPDHGGFSAEASTVDPGRKQLYGHAFALLAGASAVRAGLTGADTLFATARQAIDDHFWVEADGAAVESWDRAFAEGEPYRGQNGNMHLMEAYLSAFEVTREEVFLDRAELLAERFVLREAARHEWRVPEHFSTLWAVDPVCNAENPDDPFRPAGTLPGHALEWARLLLGLRSLRPEADWTLDAARRLFSTAIADAWDDERGGFAYTVDFDGAVINSARMHWTVAEGVGAALALYRATAHPEYAEWYATFWQYIDRRVIDHSGGSWWHELDAANRPSLVTWDGKPDLYHAWQSTLYARIIGDQGIGEAASRDAVRLPV